MNKKYIFTGVFILLLAVIVGGVWCWRNDQNKDLMAQKQIEEQQKQSEKEQKKQEEQNTQFVTDVDMDINHWQTKETRSFTVKFPREWYWLESDRKKTGYYSKVITNNPDFDINKYPDISIGAGINYPITLTNDTETIIIINGVAVTFEVGTPLESIDWQLKQAKTYMNSDAICSRTDTNVPPTAFCSFVNDDNQRIQVYFLAERSVTYAFTARTTKDSNMDMKPVLERIAKNYTPNYNISKE